MPEVDVSEILEDTDIADVFDVCRREDTVSIQTGRSVLTEQHYPDVIGVVLNVEPSANQRTGDSQTTSQVVSVVTRFRLRAAGAGGQPDVITLAGVSYTVTKVLMHTRYGAGFVKAEAESMNAADTPPVQP